MISLFLAVVQLLIIIAKGKFADAEIRAQLGNAVSTRSVVDHLKRFNEAATHAISSGDTSLLESLAYGRVLSNGDASPPKEL